ncbi:TIGR01440 family protein [Clostridium vitabionis]|jgi:uncharacterized protein (TIGR01440 family)|uniref:TIGR01440 family protein n=1 Tax=Clostridium vitabionis TaxID=2784388 RepID=UPI00188DB6B4|nr:TIGR01440 family protein [Clostridium vitabionis]
MALEEIEKESYQAVTEICEAAHLARGNVFVVGCSTSEVLGQKIGTNTNMDVAEALYRGITRALDERGIFLAAQCCEHLNRALVVDRAVMERYDLEQVNAIPQPNHAGGAFATAAYKNGADPVLVESLDARADAGIDIGDTLIGMHIHPVAVPLRISRKTIGEAHITCARRRPKYTGGQRAIYDPKLM